MILLQNINKYYGNGDNTLHVLRDITLHVRKGEFVTVLGESGSGKSTLMNIIGCMDSFDSGEYYIEDILVKSDDRDVLADIRNKKIGFIFQKYHLIQKYTILQNVMMPLLLRGESSQIAEEKAFSALQSVGLGERVKHKPNQLSGGQQQRAAIARALVTKPSLLLADEPTGALDSKTGDEIMELFCELNRNGHTIIQITHNPKVAEISNRILYLRDGKLFEK